MERGRFRVGRQHLCDVGHQVRLPVSVAERGFDIEQARCWVCRQHLCDNGGDGADIAGAFGKQHGVRVLEGKWHGARIANPLHARSVDARLPEEHAQCVFTIARFLTGIVPGAAGKGILECARPAKTSVERAHTLPLSRNDVFISVEQRTPGNLDPDEWGILRRVIDLIKTNANGAELGPVLETIENALRADQAKMIDAE